MNLKGTQSEKNVLAAFAGESQARNKYTYYALQAKSEGHEDIAELFEKMADNEREHAKVWFKLLNKGLGNTGDNIIDSTRGENYEWKSMYPEFAKQAREDGFEMLAIMFEKVAAIENSHEKKFLEAYLSFSLKNTSTKVKSNPFIEENIEPVTETEQKFKPYRCMFCGNMEETRLDVCPVCEAIGAFESVE